MRLVSLSSGGNIAKRREGACTRRDVVHRRRNRNDPDIVESISPSKDQVKIKFVVPFARLVPREDGYVVFDILRVEAILQTHLSKCDIPLRLTFTKLLANRKTLATDIAPPTLPETLYTAPRTRLLRYRFSSSQGSRTERLDGIAISRAGVRRQAHDARAYAIT
jgi:hypothetical protein